MIVDLANFIAIIYTVWVNFLLSNNTALVMLNIMILTLALYLVTSKKHGIFAR